ncbi:DUF4910 domain-containing protein [Leptospira idonii]|uniref:DUF4910 domain-containing protein n=1 Tax=Leptospira idonii TaxID=1193500 RepID=A0A4R9LY41_9LEPT|nr:DUF4910 domain-containing protein [Leptospira idonii]TGN18257.1 DUF4910 domain-containing protein [Leptospira idonii]
MYSSSADKIYDHIVALCEFDRLPGSEEYDSSLGYVVSQIKTTGCKWNVLDFPADGTYWNWQLPSGMSHWKDNREDAKIAFNQNRTLKVLEVSISGEDEREVFFVTHLCHPKPSANDNASGPAMFIELIRFFTKNTPALSLRFLFTVEYWGTIAYFSKFIENTRKAVAGISLDMVGGDQNLAGSTMIVDEIPHHLVCDLDLFLHDQMDRLARAGKYRMVGEPVYWARAQKVFYTGGSDHYILNDSTVKIPSTCLNTYPDRFYHRPEDTPDKISKETLEFFFSVVVQSLPEYALSLNGKSDRAVLLNGLSVQKDLFGFLDDQESAVLGRNKEKDSFIISHFLNHFERRAFGDVSFEKNKMFELADLLYKKSFGSALEVKTNTKTPKYQKTYLGPLYRNQLFSTISEKEKELLLSFSSKDPLFFAKSELSLNYLTLGYSLLEITWLVDHHYKSKNLFSSFESFFAILEKYRYVEAKI